MTAEGTSLNLSSSDVASTSSILDLSRAELLDRRIKKFNRYADRLQDSLQNVIQSELLENDEILKMKSRVVKKMADEVELKHPQKTLFLCSDGGDEIKETVSNEKKSAIETLRYYQELREKGERTLDKLNDTADTLQTLKISDFVEDQDRPDESDDKLRMLNGIFKLFKRILEEVIEGTFEEGGDEFRDLCSDLINAYMGDKYCINLSEKGYDISVVGFFVSSHLLEPVSHNNYEFYLKFD